MKDYKIFEKEFKKLGAKSISWTNQVQKEMKRFFKTFPEYKDKYPEEYRKRFTFKNNWQLSVIRGYGTYGAEENLFECAVMRRGLLRYDTPIASDVIGRCNVEDIIKYGTEVSKLKNSIFIDVKSIFIMYKHYFNEIKTFINNKIYYYFNKIKGYKKYIPFLCK